jgi:hypothetical protein
MSQSNVDAVVVPKIKAVRAKNETLGAKYENILAVVFWTLQSLNTSGILSRENYDTAIEKMHVVGSISDQKDFFEGYISNVKTLKKEITQLKKTDAKKLTNTPVKPKRGRKAKKVEVVNNVQDELIGKLVALANGESSDPEPQPESVAVSQLLVETAIVSEPQSEVKKDKVARTRKTKSVDVQSENAVSKPAARTRKTKSAEVPLENVVSNEIVPQEVVSNEIVPQEVVLEEVVLEEVAILPTTRPTTTAPKRAPRTRKTKSADLPLENAVSNEIVIHEVVVSTTTKRQVGRGETTKSNKNKQTHINTPPIPLNQKLDEDDDEEIQELVPFSIDDRNFLVDLKAYNDPLVISCLLYSDNDDPTPIAQLNKSSKVISSI